MSLFWFRLLTLGFYGRLRESLLLAVLASKSVVTIPELCCCDGKRWVRGAVCNLKIKSQSSCESASLVITFTICPVAWLVFFFSSCLMLPSLVSVFPIDFQKP